MTGAAIAQGSLITAEDQLRLYRESMGNEAAARQAQLADQAAGRCTCEPRSVRKRWDGSDKATVRRVHVGTCPRFKPWMVGN